MYRTRASSFFAAVTIAIALAACGGESDESADPTGQAAGEEVAVTIEGFAFEPGVLEVRVGDTVTWTNEDGIFHSATEGTDGAPGGRFDGEMDGRGTSFSFQFDEAGTYEYFCSRHAFMQGSVVVRAS